MQAVKHHVSDVRRGEGWRSERAYHSLEGKHRQNTRLLADIDPQSLRMNIGLLSGRTYAHQTRLAAMVHSMNTTLITLKGPALTSA